MKDNTWLIIIGVAALYLIFKNLSESNLLAPKPEPVPPTPAGGPTGVQTPPYVPQLVRGGY